MNSRNTKIGALMKKVIELCSNGLPCRSRIRKLMSPLERSGSLVTSSRDCSPAVETRAANRTSESPQTFHQVNGDIAAEAGLCGLGGLGHRRGPSNCVARAAPTLRAATDNEGRKGRPGISATNSAIRGTERLRRTSEPVAASVTEFKESFLMFRRM